MSTRPKGSVESLRPAVAGGMAVLAVVLIFVMSKALPHGLAVLLLDIDNTFPTSPQAMMWIAFMIALGELGLRYMAYKQEVSQRSKGYLPEDDKTVLQSGDLPDVYRKVRASPERNYCFLPRLIDRCVLQFQASGSTDQSASLMNTSMEMFVHETDLRYNMLRYLSWFIPSLGFIGTVVGIGRALSKAGADGASEDPELLGTITSNLAVAFDGTFLALAMACVLVFLQNVIQSKEEHALNLAGQYCLDNLINRLYVEK